VDNPVKENLAKSGARKGERAGEKFEECKKESRRGSQNNSVKAIQVTVYGKAINKARAKMETIKEAGAK
jgi:hypothetical protein